MFGGTKIPGTTLPLGDQKLWDAEVLGRRRLATREHAGYSLGDENRTVEVIVAIAILVAASMVLWLLIF